VEPFLLLVAVEKCCLRFLLLRRRVRSEVGPGLAQKTLFPLPRAIEVDVIVRQTGDVVDGMFGKEVLVQEPLR
jgi:hypothetical protein